MLTEIWGLKIPLWLPLKYLASTSLVYFPLSYPPPLPNPSVAYLQPTNSPTPSPWLSLSLSLPCPSANSRLVGTFPFQFSLIKNLLVFSVYNNTTRALPLTKTKRPNASQPKLLHCQIPPSMSTSRGSSTCSSCRLYSLVQLHLVQPPQRQVQLQHWIAKTHLCWCRVILK